MVSLKKKKKRTDSSRPAKLNNVLEIVQQACHRGNLIPSNHAQDQMRLRDVDYSDIEEAVDRGY